MVCASCQNIDYCCFHLGACALDTPASPFPADHTAPVDAERHAHQAGAAPASSAEGSAQPAQKHFEVAA